MKRILLLILVLNLTSCYNHYTTHKLLLHVYVYDQKKQKPIENVQIGKYKKSKKFKSFYSTNVQGYIQIDTKLTILDRNGHSFYSFLAIVKKEGYKNYNIRADTLFYSHFRIDSSRQNMYLDTIYLQPLS
jgi:hypothetical protein